VVERRDIGQAQPHQIGQCKGPRLGNVAERVPASVFIFSGIGQLADPNAVQNNPDDPFERRHRAPQWKVYRLAVAGQAAAIGLAGSRVSVFD